MREKSWRHNFESKSRGLLSKASNIPLIKSSHILNFHILTAAAAAAVVKSKIN
jgi:hypothetical protein